MQKEPRQPQPIEISVGRDELLLDELILKYPFDLRSSYLWHLLRSRGFIGGCCCCCCHPGPARGAAGAGGSVGGASAGVASGGGGGATPNIHVTLSAMGYSLVVGGSYTARVELDWSASGPANPSVDLQVRSQLVIGSYRDWTTIYPNRPASGREAWPAAAAPGERLQFRAVAKDGSGNQGISNIVNV